MGDGHHASKTLQKRLSEDSQNFIYAPWQAQFKRRCLRCGRPMNGHSYYTLYGPLVLPDGQRLYGTGDAVHLHCNRAVSVRETDFAETRLEFLEPGIHFNNWTRRFEAQWAKKRLGTHETLEQARDAIAAYRQKVSDRRKHAKDFFRRTP